MDELREVALCGFQLWLKPQDPLTDVLNLEQLPWWLSQSDAISSEKGSQLIQGGLFTDLEVEQEICKGLLQRIEGRNHINEPHANEWYGKPLPAKVWRLIGLVAWGDASFRYQIATLTENRLREIVIYDPAALPLPQISANAIWWIVSLCVYALNLSTNGQPVSFQARLRSLAFETAGSARELRFWDQWVIAETALALMHIRQLSRVGLPGEKQWPWLCKEQRYASLPLDRSETS